MEGNGKEEWTDGRKYEGTFSQGMKHGKGMLIAGNIVYVGAWENNLKHGIGHETQLAGNTRRKGEWKKGKLFRWLSGTETVSGSIGQKFIKKIEHLQKTLAQEEEQQEQEQ